MHNTSTSPLIMHTFQVDLPGRHVKCHHSPSQKRTSGRKPHQIFHRDSFWDDAGDVVTCAHVTSSFPPDSSSESVEGFPFILAQRAGKFQRFAEVDYVSDSRTISLLCSMPICWNGHPLFRRELIFRSCI